MSLSTPPRLLAAAMAAHLPVPHLPVLLLFVFLAVHVLVPASHAIPPPLPTTYDGSICSESVKCGHVNIRYPFYLSDATREIAGYGYNYSCGYTDLMISCQGEGPAEIPIITLGGDNYTVQEIFYSSHTITLADSDVVLGGSCPAVSHNVSFDELWLQHSSIFNNLTFFFGCDTVRSGFDEYRIKCPRFKGPPDAGSGEDSFVLITDDELDRYQEQEQELARNCSMIVTMPVIVDYLIAASNQINFTSGGYGDVLKRGFELEWSLITRAEDGCHQCEESYGQCAYSQHKEFMGCVCDGGRKVGKPYCEHIIAPANTTTASRSCKSS